MHVINISLLDSCLDSLFLRISKEPLGTFQKSVITALGQIQLLEAYRDLAGWLKLFIGTIPTGAVIITVL